MSSADVLAHAREVLQLDESRPRAEVYRKHLGAAAEVRIAEEGAVLRDRHAYLRCLRNDKLTICLAHCLQLLQMSYDADIS
jgi:hypothetical protein